MFPNAPQDQLAESASLPPVPLQPQFGQPIPGLPLASMPAQGPNLAVPVPTGVDPKAQAVAQTRQLFEQYKNDPHGLSDALQQVKSNYIAAQYNVAPNIPEK
jgi:hypothetical protein